MAIIKCPECGKEISDSALSCPHCGKAFLFLKNYNKKYNYIKLIITLAILPMLFCYIANYIYYDEGAFEDLASYFLILYCGIPPALIVRYLALKHPIQKYQWMSVLITIPVFLVIGINFIDNVRGLKEEGLLFVALLISTIITNSILLAGTGKFILIKQNKQEKQTFFNSATWKDLRIPLLWIPGITFIINAILVAYFPFLSGFYYSRKIGVSIEIPEIITVSLLSAIISNLAYLTAPLATRFLILKTPMKSMALSTLIATFILGMGARLLLMATGLSLGKTANVPILQEIAIYYVLTAGNTVNQFIYKEHDR